MEYKKRKTIWLWFVGLNVAIVLMTFLLAWLLSIWTWWSLVGAFWVFVAFSFTCSVQKNVLDWLVKNDPVQMPKQEKGDSNAV